MYNIPVKTHLKRRMLGQGCPHSLAAGRWAADVFSETHTSDLSLLVHHPFANRHEKHDWRQAGLAPGGEEPAEHVGCRARSQRRKVQIGH